MVLSPPQDTVPSLSFPFILFPFPFSFHTPPSFAKIPSLPFPPSLPPLHCSPFRFSFHPSPSLPFTNFLPSFPMDNFPFPLHNQFFLFFSFSLFLSFFSFILFLYFMGKLQNSSPRGNNFHQPYNVIIEENSVLCTCQISYTLLSPSEKLLKIPQVNHTSAVEHSNRVAALAVWSLLPSSLCNIPNFLQFKLSLKMHLFPQALFNS